MRRSKVAILWHGMPAYAAYLIRSVIEDATIDLHLFATKSPEDPDELERIIGRPIEWVDSRSARAKAERVGADVWFVTGWAFDECNEFVRVAKSRRSPVVAMIDNRWRGDLRQRLGSFYFRLALRRSIDFAWVPGKSATRLCRSFGFPPEAIFDGLYGGDGSIFTLPVAHDREARIGFVGQLVRRKGFDLLVEAFRQFRREFPEYELHAYGAGELARLAVGVPGIVVHQFAKPAVIATAMRTFRTFVMPSRDDNWPLALHEAALSGCSLVTTQAVGNAEELVEETNGIVIPAASGEALVAGLKTVASWPADRRHLAAIVSRRLAEAFGPARWRRQFLRLCSTAAPSFSGRSATQL
jgi:glycosyltransferase involved in cell wall biosynthesis